MAVTDVAQQKTASLVRTELPIWQLHPNPNNPNRMNPKEFDLLVENMRQVGFVDPVFVRPHPDGMPDKYLIIGGHHRTEAAKFLGFKSVPCVVTTDPEMTAELEEFQLVRMNVIRGNIQPSLFADLYRKYAPKYGEAVLQDMFGFADQAAFQKLIKDTKAALPKEMKAKFAEAAKDIKTIDGLAKLLNRMFTMHGNTLEYGWMVVDYGQKDSIWVRISGKTHKNLVSLGERCVEASVSLDSVLGGLLQLIADGKLDAEIKSVISKSPVVIPKPKKGALPLEAELEKQKALQQPTQDHAA